MSNVVIETDEFINQTPETIIEYYETNFYSFVSHIQNRLTETVYDSEKLVANGELIEGSSIIIQKSFPISTIMTTMKEIVSQVIIGDDRKVIEVSRLHANMLFDALLLLISYEERIPPEGLNDVLSELVDVYL